MADLASIALKMSRVPDAVIADTTRAVLADAARIGGRMNLNGRTVELGAETRGRRRSGKTSTATIVCTPAGAWSIKSNGRRGGYRVKPRTARAIRTPYGPRASATIRTATHGDNRWGRLAARADDTLTKAAKTQVSRAVS